MRLEETPGHDQFVVVVKLDRSGSIRVPFSAGHRVTVVELDGDRFRLQHGESGVTVMAAGGENLDSLRHAAQERCLVKVDGIRGYTIDLEVRCFNSGIRTDSFRILVPPDAMAQVAEDRGFGQEKVLGWLSREFLLLDRATTDCAFTSGGVASEIAGSVRLVGRRHQLHLSKHEDKDLMVVRKLARGSARGETALIEVEPGNLGFTGSEGEATGEAVYVQELSTEQYLSLWRDYSEKEKEHIEFVREAVGTIGYQSVLRVDDGFRLQVRKDDVPGMQAARERSVDRFELASQPGGSGSGSKLLFQVVSWGQEEVVVDPLDDAIDTPPPSAGYLIPSLRGQEAHLERRTQALERVRDGKSKLPRLVELLETGAVVGPRLRRTDARIGQVAKDHFGSGATRMQLEALRAAVATPDIALIQGPPGTGKTKVIAALADALAPELARVPVRHRLLLASEQNEAVDHLARTVAEHAEIPPHVVGRDNRAGRDWAEVTAARIREHWQKRDAAIRTHRLGRLVAQIESGRILSDSAVSLLDEFHDYVPSDAPRRIRRDVRSLREEILDYRRRSWEIPVAEGRATRLVREIPTSGEAVLDGGSIVGGWLLAELGDRVPELVRADLEELAGLPEAANSCPPGLADRLARTRDLLLDELTGQRHQPRDWGERVRSLLGNLVNKLRESLTEEDLRILIALEFADRLEEDPAAATHSLLQMAEAVVATNQKISSLQAFRDLGDDIWFDTVIVDEAARADPLDLMIPMSLARRRIILVGDHRQLPQTLEPEVEREFGKNLRAELQSALKDSLFERLISHVREADSRAGRQRVVTLDAQFRMHPELGEFVSEAFYSADGGLSSPRPAEHFIHDDPDLQGQPAVWIDVPAREGGESPGQSKKRSAEVPRVIELLSRWSKLPSEPTIGAMALYAAQSEEIRRQARSELVAPDGRPLDDADGIRIGNVDAFQGREFDHVVLSLVRSNSARDPRRAFGFLALANRLCVAMSRQRKLLVVVGDLNMFSTALAAESVPALWRFARMCRERDAIR